jgi:hypothetical protein
MINCSLAPLGSEFMDFVSLIIIDGILLSVCSPKTKAVGLECR